MDEQGAQRKYMQLQLFKEQMEGLVKQKQMIDEKSEELMATVSALNDFKNAEKGDETWSPFGSGVFIQSDIKDVEEVAVAVGAGVVIKKKIGDAIKTIGKRLAEVQGVDKEVTEKLNDTIQNINTLQTELQKFMEEQEKADSGVGQNVNEDDSVKPDYGIDG